jgi:hypothetical protein
LKVLEATVTSRKKILAEIFIGRQYESGSDYFVEKFGR